MKRIERSTLNALRKSITADTVNVEIPVTFTHEGRQAIHEMLTVEKDFVAVRINWNDMEGCYAIHYVPCADIKGRHAARMEQEGMDIDDIMKSLPKSDYTWNGYKKPGAEESAPEEVEEKPMKKSVKKSHRNLYTTAVREKFTLAIRDAIREVKAGEVTKVSISEGNRKMGAIPSVSLVPYAACPASCAKTCAGDCYAANMANFRGTTLKAWARNMALSVYRPDIYWTQVNAKISMSRFFRFHVGGDIISPAYFGKMVECARNNPGCDIVAFTKRHEWVNQYIRENGSLPRNLHVIMSGWENLDPVNPYGLPETNIIMPGMECPENWTRCSGNCSDCARANGGCWAAGCGDVIAFDLH